VLSVLLGVLYRYAKLHWAAGLVGSVALMALIIWKSPDIAAWCASHGMPFMDTGTFLKTEGWDAGKLTKRWDQVLLVYCFIASIVPMWLLLQPRGVIGATFLYAALFFGVVGTLVGGWDSAGTLAIQWPAFKGWTNSAGEMLFPFLFITIACGACSGFHSIVASGTTSKQVRVETDIKPVAYGAMLLEAMVAVFALSCVMVMAPGSRAGSPDAIYARGIGNFMHLVGIDIRFAVGFGLLAFSSFVFDTLDVCTRLGRYVLQEMTGLKGLAGGAIATLITLAGPAAYLALSPPGSFRTFWVIFGTSNQLLAALTLVGVSVWLWRTGRPVWFALAPAMFMVANTATALVMNFIGFYRKYAPAGATDALINMCIAAVLFLLGGLVVFEALRVWRKYRTQPVGGAFPVIEPKPTI
jgi:carbon starvation protein